MSKATDELRHEHEAILFALQILESMTGLIAGGMTVDSADITRYLEFLKEFADRCHHGKEEDILFPALVSAGVPEKGGPVGVMLAEHARGRECIRDMETASAARGYSAFTRAAEAYTVLLRSHIQKENNVLFPMADQLLAQAQLDRIYGLFEEHEDKVMGRGRHEELHALLKELKNKYLG